MPRTQKRPRIAEKSVELEVRQLAELYGWRTHKIDVFKGVEIRYPGKDSYRRFSEGFSGQPDLILIPPGGGLYVETKAPDGELSQPQNSFHTVLREDGFEVIVPRSGKHFEQLITELLPGWMKARYTGKRLRDWVGGSN